jgi:(p)ppGpp synthase/HD superfamily hydrolase
MEQRMNLERAIQIAVEAHAGQIDKANEPYILHPLRVMFGVSGDEARIVAVLHDVVEDCEGWTFERLEREGFSPTVIQALDSVTKRPEEENNYMAFIGRSELNEIGRQVKISDLKDNLDMSRIANPTERDYQRIAKYEQGLAHLSRWCL